MDTSLTQVSDTPASTSVPRDALDRLTPFGARGGIVVTTLLLLASFFLAGYFVIYWRNADMDFMVIYSALAMNDGLPQHYFDHPAYLTILSVKYWFQLLHSLGLLDAYKLSAVPSAANGPAFDAAMTGAVRAGRIVSLITTFASFGVFTALIWRVVKDWRIAVLASFAFAFSGGVSVEMRILRTELISGSAIIIAFLLLVIVGRKASAWRPLWLGVAALLCVLGLINKVQTILLIAALPAIILPFGSPSSASTQFWTGARAFPAMLITLAAAALFGWLAYPLVATGFAPVNVNEMGLRPAVAGMLGSYQIAIVMWIVLCMIAYALIWRVNMRETVASLLAMIAGASLALLVLKLQYHLFDVVAVMNPLELLLSFGTLEVGASVDRSLGGLVSLVASQVGPLLARYTFFLHSSPRPAVFLIWFVIPGIVYAWHRRERQTAIQATILMLAAFAIDLIGVRRGLKTEYFIFTDPFIIIAGALLLDRLTDLRWHKWAYPLGLALIIAHVTVSQAEPVKHVMKRSGPEYICIFNMEFLPKLPLPWCAVPKPRP